MVFRQVQLIEMPDLNMYTIKDTIKEFKPTILFLVRFFGIYLVGSLLYGWYVTVWHPRPDPATSWVTQQSVDALNLFGWDVRAVDHSKRASTYIVTNEDSVLAVYEGCNGINVAVVFLSFLLAFGPYKKTLLWFIPLGLLVIHVSNITRIVLLAMVAMNMPDLMYFSHKYLFTAFIYLFVFMLWLWWVLRLARSEDPKT